MLVPAGTPNDIVHTLNGLIIKAVQKEDFRQKIAQTGADVISESPEYFKKMLKEEIDRWSVVVKLSKAKPG